MQDILKNETERVALANALVDSMQGKTREEQVRQLVDTLGTVIAGITAMMLFNLQEEMSRYGAQLNEIQDKLASTVHTSDGTLIHVMRALVTLEDACRDVALPLDFAEIQHMSIQRRDALTLMRAALAQVDLARGCSRVRPEARRA